ncbi:MAG: glycosidase [Bacteroidetes bacterium]|nr:glycosidase [Bacteroidota bacterium]
MVENELSVLTSQQTMKKAPELRFNTTSHPLVYEVNTRVLLRELQAEHGEEVTLGTIPDKLLDEWAALGFDAIWLMGVWTTGKIGLEIARTDKSLLEEYKRVLPNFSEEDVIGSPYAVKAYVVSPALGGNKGLLQLRNRMRQRGLSLVLDFVPNHTARDHQWVSRHPEYYMNGREGEDIQKPEYYFATSTIKGLFVLAFGRDPNYPGWTDTAQLDIRNAETRKAMISTIKKIAAMCDGIRCDMGMLLLNDVFEKTWPDRALSSVVELASGESWAEAIRAVKAEVPNFKFIAEAYWDREWQLQQLGFDYTYDKRLYERLAREGAGAVYDHLKAEPEYQKKSVRFIENHDEPRAAQVFSADPWHFAAATVMSCVPGMALFHEGQLTGSRIKLPVQLGRRPTHEQAPQIAAFYNKLIPIVSHPVFRQGQWKLLQAKPAWHENHTWTNFLAFWWYEKKEGARFIVINYAPLNGQCYVELTLDGIDGSSVEFRDLIGTANFVRERSALATKGMYFDLPGYSLHIFDVIPHRPPGKI